MRHTIMVILIAAGCITVSSLFGDGNEDGLFFAIIGVGIYAAGSKGES